MMKVMFLREEMPPVLLKLRRRHVSINGRLLEVPFASGLLEAQNSELIQDIAEIARGIGRIADYSEYEHQFDCVSRPTKSGDVSDSENFRRGRAPKGWYRQPESRSNWEKARAIRKRQRICRP